jgi:hypothetical protein
LSFFPLLSLLCCRIRTKTKKRREVETRAKDIHKRKVPLIIIIWSVGVSADEAGMEARQRDVGVGM